MKLINDDCLNVMKNIPNDSIDLIITDPPYGVNYSNNKYFDDSLKNIETNIDSWFFEMSRVLKNTRHIYVYTPTLNIDIFISSFKKYFKFSNLLVARAKSNNIGKYRYKFDTQYVIFGSKGKRSSLLNKVDVQKKSHTWIKDKRNKNNNEYTYLYSSILTDRANEEYRIKKHPNGKNIKQLKNFILLSSKENEIVLDSFMGSGSVGEACSNTNRDFVGIELNKEYYDVACGRVN